MNFVKKTSSVTRGRGMMWACKTVLPMPAYAETKCAIYSFTDILFKTSEKRKAFRPSEMERDNTDAIKILSC